MALRIFQDENISKEKAGMPPHRCSVKEIIDSLKLAIDY
jgi:hypothetical protein